MQAAIAMCRKKFTVDQHDIQCKHFRDQPLAPSIRLIRLCKTMDFRSLVFPLIIGINNQNFKTFSIKMDLMQSNATRSHIQHKTSFRYVMRKKMK